jgi:hypothetical protein
MVEHAIHMEKLASEAMTKIATMEAGMSLAARGKKLAAATTGALNVWGANVTLHGKARWNGPAVWDITMNCICAIDALEEPAPGTKFFNWYQLFKAFEAGAFCFFITEEAIEVCPLPSIVRVDDARRLHSSEGPAFGWLDDVRDYYWHGVRVEAYVAENPERISVADIEGEMNAEVRRVKMERYGVGRYLVQSGAQVLNADDYGTLYKREIAGGEPLVMVKVINATAEPDGSFKDYFLRVPPNMQTAREAVAWTFDKAAEDYGPVKES